MTMKAALTGLTELQGEKKRWKRRHEVGKEVADGEVWRGGQGEWGGYDQDILDTCENISKKKL